MNRYKGVSGWAAPFVDEETGEVLEPKNVTPRTELGAWYAQRQAQARARGKQHKGQAGTWFLRAIGLFIVSGLHVPHWLGFWTFWASVLCGLLAMLNIEEWNLARMETHVDPRSLLDD